MDIIARNTGVKPWATFAGETFWLQSRYLSQVGTLPPGTPDLVSIAQWACSSGRGRRSVFPLRGRVRPLHGPLTGLPLLVDCRPQQQPTPHHAPGNPDYCNIPTLRTTKLTPIHYRPQCRNSGWVGIGFKADPNTMKNADIHMCRRYVTYFSFRAHHA